MTRAKVILRKAADVEVVMVDFEHGSPSPVLSLADAGERGPVSALRQPIPLPLFEGERLGEGASSG